MGIHTLYNIYIYTYICLGGRVSFFMLLTHSRHTGSRHTGSRQTHSRQTHSKLTCKLASLENTPATIAGRLARLICSLGSAGGPPGFPPPPPPAAAGSEVIWRRFERRSSFFDLRSWIVVSSRFRRAPSASMPFLKDFWRWGGGERRGEGRAGRGGGGRGVLVKR